MKKTGILLHDALESIELIEEYSTSIKEEDFLQDKRTQDAINRRLEIIGEAIKNIPIEFKNQHSSVPWREIAGMRDVLIHGYARVNPARIWRTITTELPLFKMQILDLLKRLEE